MATHYLNDASVVLNSVDLSDDIESVTLNTSRDVGEDTAMGDNSRSFVGGGLKGWDVSITFNQDFAASQVDVTLAAIEAGAAAVPIVIKPVSGSVTATNPSYSGNVIMSSYGPIAGSVGGVHKVSVELQGTGDLTRATS